MRVYDISMSITYDMPVYKGKEMKKPKLTIDSDYNSGPVYESRLEINMHTGTHIDAPLHMVMDGHAIDQIDLENVVTKCKVFDLTDVEEKISQEHLSDRHIAEGDFIILKTKNSYLDILENEFVYVDRTGAEYLKNKKINGVGIDSLGIERNQPEHETHRLLLEAGIIILEGLRLKEVREGEYLLVAAPINVAGAEAAPARALLIEQA